MYMYLHKHVICCIRVLDVTINYYIDLLAKNGQYTMYILSMLISHGGLEEEKMMTSSIFCNKQPIDDVTNVDISRGRCEKVLMLFDLQRYK